MDYVIKTLKNRADSGDCDAMLELGKKFAYGDGVKANTSKAEAYLLKADKSGDERAPLELGKFYKDAKFNPTNAKYWLEKAASNGSGEASYLIGCLFYEGAFESYDYESAIRWFSKPAQNGDAQAQLLLGLSYYELDKEEECFYWLKKASEQNNGEAQYRYAIYADLSEKQMEQWFKKALDNGYEPAYQDLGDLYIYSDDCKDYGKGLEMYNKAAELDFPYAMRALGNLYFEGEIVERDLEKAFYWYNRGFRKYSYNTYFGPGRCYLYGAGVERNVKKALKYLNKAAKCDDGDANYELGNCYFNGWGVPEDKQKAKSLWQQAAEHYSRQAEKALAENFK